MPCVPHEHSARSKPVTGARRVQPRATATAYCGAIDRSRWALISVRALRLLPAITFIWATLLTPAWPQNRYVLDPRSGSVEFSVTHFGLFTSHGRFRHFSGELRIDPRRPERTQIAVEINAQSIEVPWKDWIAKLLSSAYFDAGEYPAFRFRSTAVSSDPNEAYWVHGFMEIRGTIRPLTLKVQLTNRKEDPADGVETVDLVATGDLKRSEFDMTADPLAVSDDVNLTIRARLSVREQLVGKR